MHAYMHARTHARTHAHTHIHTHAHTSLKTQGSKCLLRWHRYYMVHNFQQLAEEGEFSEWPVPCTKPSQITKRQCYKLTTSASGTLLLMLEALAAGARHYNALPVQFILAVTQQCLLRHSKLTLLHVATYCLTQLLFACVGSSPKVHCTCLVPITIQIL